MSSQTSFSNKKAQFVGGRRRSSPPTRRKEKQNPSFNQFDLFMDMSINPLDELMISVNHSKSFQPHRRDRSQFKSNRKFVQNPNRSMRNSHNIGQPRSTGGNH